MMQQNCTSAVSVQGVNALLGVSEREFGVLESIKKCYFLPTKAIFDTI